MPTTNKVYDDSTKSYRDLPFQEWAQEGRHGNEFKVPLLSAKARENLLRNTLDSRQGSTGAYTIPGITIQEGVELSLVGSNVFRQCGATIDRRPNGDPSGVAILDDGVTEGVIVPTNTTPGAEQAEVDPGFGQRDFFPFKYSSNTIVVSNTLLRDAPGLEGDIGRVIGVRIARKQLRSWTLGTPWSIGIPNRAALGVTAASSIAITPDEVINLQENLESEMAEAPAAAYMCHRKLYGLLRRLKDSTGSYIFRGEPWGQLWGRPVHFNRMMPSTITSGSRCLLFGDWSKLRIVDVNTVRISRFSEDFIENDQTAFVGFLESDANLLDVPTYPPILAIQQP